MYCSQCGKEIKNDIKFCPYCGAGTKISDQHSQENTGGKAVQKNRKPVMKALIVILCVIVAVIILLFFWSPSSAEKTSEVSLEEEGMEIISLMCDKLDSSAYAEWSGITEDALSVINVAAEGDYAVPEAVYVITLPKAETLLEDSGYYLDEWDSDLTGYINSRMLPLSLVNIVNGDKGSVAVVASSSYSATKTFVNDTLTESICYLYTFENGQSVIVTFVPDLDGSVTGTGYFMFNDDCQTAEEFEEAYCDGDGFEISLLSEQVDSSAENIQESSSLEEECLEMVDLLYSMTACEEYTELFWDDDQYQQIASILMTGDYYTPSVVYEIEVQDSLKDIVNAGGYKLPSSILEQMDVLSLMKNAVISNCGEESIICASAYSVTKTFVSTEILESKAYLYTFKNGMPVLITVMPGEDNTVIANGVFVYDDSVFFQTDSAEQIEAELSDLGYSCSVSILSEASLENINDSAETAQDETEDTSTAFAEYLYMEGKSYTELEGEFTETVQETTDGFKIHYLIKTAEIENYTWAVCYLYYSDISEEYEDIYSEGIIVSVSFYMDRDDIYTEDDILNYVQSFYSDYDYVDTFSDDEYICYTSYQWDAKENGNYNVELILLDDSYSLYFSSYSEDGDGDPASVIDNVNHAETSSDLLDNFILCYEQEEIAELEEELSPDMISLELKDIQRLSELYAIYDLTNIGSISAAVLGTFMPDSHFYVLCVESTVTTDSGTDTFECNAVVGWYDGKWRIYNASTVTDGLL